jgi:stringent starvation protein B
MSSTERPSKREAFLALMREGWTSLHLDARRSGVIVPANLRNEAHLVLQYGHDLPIPIPDLEIDDYGVRATLSFQRMPHLTVVPWSAVYVVVCNDGRGILFAEDVPEDVTIISTRSTGDGAPVTDEVTVPAEDEELPPARRAALRSVPADAAAELDEPLAARRRRRPQLRLVK